MQKIFYLALFSAVFSTPLFAQEIEITDPTLKGQFAETVDGSNSYQEYKVISKAKLAVLRKNIFDSIAVLKNEIVSGTAEISAQQRHSDSLATALKTTKSQLATSKEKENGIEFLGILTSKSAYNTFVWTLILLLLLAGGFLFYKFLNSHKEIKATELKLAEMEMELEGSHQNSLEREQKLRRKLQDEINKNRR